MSPRRTLACLCAAALLWCGVTSAGAADADLDRRARVLYDTAMAQWDDGRFAEAWSLHGAGGKVLSQGTLRRLAPSKAAPALAAPPAAVPGKAARDKAASPPRKEAPPSLPAAIVGARFGSLDEILASADLMSSWIGLPVELETKTGTSIRGRLVGVRGTTVVLERQHGKRWSGDLFDARAARLVSK